MNSSEIHQSGVDQHEEAETLQQRAIDAFCTTLGVQEYDGSMSNDKINEIDLQVNQDLKARKMVIVKNDEEFQQLMRMVNDFGNYTSMLDRLSERFICVDLGNSSQTLLFLPLGWSCLKLQNEIVIQDDKGHTRGLVQSIGDSSAGRLDLKPYYKIFIRPSDENRSNRIVEVRGDRDECVVKVIHTADMAQSDLTLEVMTQIILAYMDNKYPCWRNPMAYWDD